MFPHVRRAMFVSLIALTLVVGCDDTKSSSVSAEEDHAHAAHEEGHHHQQEHDHEGHAEEQHQNERATVEVSKEGTKFEPSVDASRIPQGAWHCNMNGEVHYAATEKGDGQCPVCGMNLKKK